MTEVSHDLDALAAYEAYLAGRVAGDARRGRISAELDARVAERRAARDGMRERRRHWLDWTPDEFDAAAKPVQGALFAEPDQYGTPDMFADLP